MKILMLVDQKYPTDHAFLEEVYSKIFVKKGHEIVWVMKHLRTNSKLVIKKWNNSEVLVLPSTNNFLIDNLLLMLYLNFVTKLLKNEKFDMVYVRNDPIMGLYAAKLSKKFKIPFVYQLSHLKSEETVYFSQKTFYGSRVKNYIIGKIAMNLRNKVLKKADLVLPVSDAMKSYLIKKGLRKSDLETLPLGADTTINPAKIEGKIIRKKYGLGLNPVLVYLGTLIRTRNPFFLFDVVKRLLPEYPRLKLLVVGEGKVKNDVDEYKDYIKKNNLSKNIVFTGQIPRNKVPKYLKAANIGLSVFPPLFFLKMNSPIKLIEYMNLELPVVCNNFNDEQKRMVGKAKCGYCVNYNINSFCDAISQLLQKKAVKNIYGQKR